MSMRHRTFIRLLVLAAFLAVAGAVSLNESAAEEAQASTNGIGWCRHCGS